MPASREYLENDNIVEGALQRSSDGAKQRISDAVHHITVTTHKQKPVTKQGLTRTAVGVRRLVRADSELEAL